MFETLDTMISLGVIFLILSMVNKYLISIIKRFLKTKAKVISSEMETFIGENTTKILIPFLEKNEKHLNFLDQVKGKNALRKLSKEQLKGIVGKLEDFLNKNEDAVEIKNTLGLELSVEEIKGKLGEIKIHLNTLHEKIENMYDNTLDKISELYTAKLRLFTLFTGMALAFIVNADFFGIYNSLSKSPVIRDKLVAQSETIELEMKKLSEKIEKNAGENVKKIQKELDSANDTVTSLLGRVESTGIVLGWTDEKMSKACSGLGSFVYKLIGLLIAGLLISFGAPFWHDFIGTFTGLRKTLRGKKAESGELSASPPANTLPR